MKELTIRIDTPWDGADIMRKGESSGGDVPCWCTGETCEYIAVGCWSDGRTGLRLSRGPTLVGSQRVMVSESVKCEFGTNRRVAVQAGEI